MVHIKTRDEARPGRGTSFGDQAKVPNQTKSVTLVLQWRKKDLERKLGRELEFMYKIVIQTQDSETVINNVQPEDLAFWRELLEESISLGKILNLEFIDLSSTPNQAA